jgi:hypothetical protein
LTKSEKGKLKIRSLEHRGSYVICKCVDPLTMPLTDAKRKLILKDDRGEVTEYFIIPIRNSKRAL